MKPCCVVLITILSASCAESPISPPVLPPLQESVITGAVPITSDGLIDLYSPLTSSAEIDEVRAAQIAEAYIPMFAGYFRGMLEREHGAPIDFDALEIVRVAYAQSPYDPPAWLSMPAQKAHGSYYLVSFANDQVLVLTLAVAARSTDLGIRPDGLIQFPLVSGNEFEIFAWPRATVNHLPALPERAVQIAYAESGVRIARAPELYLPGAHEREDGAFLRPSNRKARWRLEFERPVRAVIHNAQDTLVTSLYLTLEGQWQIPALEQSPHIRIMYIPDHESPEPTFATILRIPQYPTKFVDVELR